MEEKRALLKRYFGHAAFRGGQEALIDAILSGRDVLGVMPTGGGKSVCYQLPALLLPGLTIVVSPLISLMKDQVAALTEAGIPAAFLNSSLSFEQLRSTYAKASAGQYKLLYVAPERLETESFLSLTARVPVSLLAVDEAHCISQWGQDFRPSYLKIAAFLSALPHRPVIAAFTATATAQVRADIIGHLGLANPLCNITGFDRPNLYFEVLHPNNKLAKTLELVQARAGKAGIVYCATRAGVERVCEFLCDRGIAATRYHAGLSEEERRENQDDFRFDRKSVMVATNAFGMGIDKSNVSFVIHYNMPKSIEAYYQEAGRAGRDGAEADCILLFSPGDVQTARFLINNGSDNEEMDAVQREEVRRQDLERLDAMIGYCKTKSCLRGYILDYFGQKHPAMCGNCGSCKGNFQSVEITREAQIILSCVKRVHDALGYNVGANLLGNILRGSRNKRVQELGLDKISTYGLLKDRTRSNIHAMIDHLEAEGYLRTEQEHQSVFLTPAAGEVLYRGKTVTMLVEQTHEPETPVTETAKLTADDAQLFDALKELRLELAKKAEIPAFVVFSNATLADMAKKKPATMSEFKKVSGVGEIKATWYGTAFLKCIQSYLDENA